MSIWQAYRHIISHIEVERGALARVPAWIRAAGYARPLIVADENTDAAAGRTLRACLDAEGVPYDAFTYPPQKAELIADETAAGALLAAFEPANDLIVAVGSGTLNDICKYVSFKADRPFIVVGTAPSMDGYASAGAAMTLHCNKITPQTHTPQAIFCDADILCAAPLPMLAAGLGDMLGKITSLADWQLSRLLTGEEMPPEIVDLVNTAVRRCSDSVAGASRREPEAVRAIAEGLILSGLAMSLYGDSRPASGTEHHLAHYWELRFLAEGRAPALHGLKVGVAALCALRLWKGLPEAPPKPGISADIEPLIRARYGLAAPELLKTQNPEIPYGELAAKWPSVRAIADSLPAPEEVEALLSALNAPLAPAEIGVDPVTLRESVLLARQRKKTYTLLQLLGNCGLLEEAGRTLADTYARRALKRVRCFVLDMDGTVYLGDTLLPGTRAFLDAVRRSGRDVMFFTNNSSQNPQSYLNKLRTMGIELAPKQLMMSTQVLLEFLQTERPGKRVWAAGTPDMLDQFREAGIDPEAAGPEIAVLGFDTTLTYAKLQTLHEAVRNGAELLAVNCDYVCPVPGGSVPDCGAMAALLEAIHGFAPQTFGKPARRAMDFILRHAGRAEHELCFVGDRLYTDIAIASGSKAVSALVLSGESRAEDIARCPNACPDVIAKDLGELATLF